MIQPINPQLGPILDVRIANGCKYGLKYAVFQRPAGQLQGGRLLARFNSVDLAEAFIGVFPSLSRTIDPEQPQGARLGVLKGGRS